MFPRRLAKPPLFLIDPRSPKGRLDDGADKDIKIAVKASQVTPSPPQALLPAGGG